MGLPGLFMGLVFILTVRDPQRKGLVQDASGTNAMALERNSEVIGAGAAALGSPVNAVAWLANTLGRLGIGLKAGNYSNTMWHARLAI